MSGRLLDQDLLHEIRVRAHTLEARNFEALHHGVGLGRVVVKPKGVHGPVEVKDVAILEKKGFLAPKVARSSEKPPPAKPRAPRSTKMKRKKPSISSLRSFSAMKGGIRFLSYGIDLALSFILAAGSFAGAHLIAKKLGVLKDQPESTLQWLERLIAEQSLFYLGIGFGGIYLAYLVFIRLFFGRTLGSYFRPLPKTPRTEKT